MKRVVKGVEKTNSVEKRAVNAMPSGTSRKEYRKRKKLKIVDWKC